MDGTTSDPKSCISSGASLIFLWLMATSWKVLEGAGFSSSSSSSSLGCPTPRRRRCPEGAVDPFPWPIPHPAPATAAQMFQHGGQEVGEAFPALFLQLGILCHDSLGWPWPAQRSLDLWKSGIVTSRLPFGGTSPPRGDIPVPAGGSWIFGVIHGVCPCYPSILGSSSSSSTAQTQQSTTEHNRAGCSAIPAPACSGKTNSQDFRGESGSCHPSLGTFLLPAPDPAGSQLGSLHWELKEPGSSLGMFWSHQELGSVLEEEEEEGRPVVHLQGMLLEHLDNGNRGQIPAQYLGFARKKSPAKAELELQSLKEADPRRKQGGKGSSWIRKFLG